MLRCLIDVCSFVEPPAEVQAALNIPTNYDVGRGGT